MFKENKCRGRDFLPIWGQQTVYLENLDKISFTVQNLRENSAEFLLYIENP